MKENKHLKTPELHASFAAPASNGAGGVSLSDHDIFSHVYLAYAEGILAFITAILGSPNEAEELAQEVFFRIWESKDKIDFSKNIKSYLFTFAKRLAIDRLRHRKVMERYTEYVAAQPEATDPASDQPIITREEEILFQSAIEAMPPKQREIFMMSLHEGMSDDQLAEHFSISKRTVQTHLYNATRYIRQTLDRG